MTIDLYNFDCRDALNFFVPKNSVDSFVTDPPYGLNFMGKGWDRGVPGVEFWQRVYDTLKPGGHLLAFGGSRTYHRLVCAIEDAGFEIRDQIMWVYGSGFPKSHNLEGDWDGWGTALKPAHEPICVARKPLVGTVAANVLAHGTGALNIDGCRVGDSKDVPASVSRAAAGNSLSGSADGSLRRETGLESGHNPNLGRWPANLIHDGSAEVIAAFPQAPGQLGRLTGSEPSSKTANTFGAFTARAPSTPRDDTGSAARFFYCAKASKKEKGEGNNHPTVKPLALMRYLTRLVTPPGGTVADNFMGSGSTGVAAVQEGFSFIGCEDERPSFEIAKRRIEAAKLEVTA